MFQKDDFLKELNINETKAEKLQYGFRIDLNESNVHIAEELNRDYQNLVWSKDNIASNNDLCIDEKIILDKYLNNIKTNASIMEIGCGSGRVTRYLSNLSDNITAIDFQERIIENVKKKFCYGVKFKVIDFTTKVQIGKFNFNILFENFIGMILKASDRQQVFNNIYSHLDNDGTAILAFRVLPELTSNLIYQSMPIHYGNYHKKTFGFSINWSIDQICKEISHTSLKIVNIEKGTERPAGGIMYYAILTKGE